MHQAAAAVSEQRQWERLMAMARIGAIPGDGVNRACLTALDRDARRLLIGWAQAAGATISVDAAANLWLRREGTDPAAPAVVTGSHMDTQPNGGRFDGIYGVIAGLEALAALHDAGLVQAGQRLQPGHHAVDAVEAAAGGLAVHVAAGQHRGGVGIGAGAAQPQIGGFVDGDLGADLLPPGDDAAAGLAVERRQAGTVDAVAGDGADPGQFHQPVPLAGFADRGARGLGGGGVGHAAVIQGAPSLRISAWTGQSSAWAPGR